MNNISKYTNFVGIGTEVTKKVWGNILGTDDPEVKKGVSDEIRNFFKAQYAAAAEAQKTEGKKINNAKTAEEIEAEKERQQELEKKRKEAAEKAAAERKAAEEKEKQEQERNWQAYLAAQKQFEDEKAKATMSAMDYELLKLKDHFDAIRAAYKKVGKDVTAINALENTERAKIIEKSREVDRKFLKQSEDARKQEEKAKKEGIKNEADALVERTKAAVAQRIADNKARQERKQTEEEQARTDREKLYNEIINATEVAQSILDIEKQKTDRLIELQQQRVDAAKDNSKVSLKIEEDRLNALLERRQKYERAQRAIDAAVIVANQAVAISGAIRAITDAGGNPVLIAANAIAIAASIAAAIAAVRSGFGDVGFKEGGYTGDGDPNQESTAVGRRPYKYHKGEFVMDADLTADHRDLFEGIHKRRLKVRQLDDGQYYIAPDVDKLSADYQTAKYSTQDGQVLAELSAMRRLMQQREVSVTNNFDADGFGQAVASQMGQIHLKNLRRN
jgi:chemotaxis protein histidine kinase CheA